MNMTAREQVEALVKAAKTLQQQLDDGDGAYPSDYHDIFNQLSDSTEALTTLLSELDAVKAENSRMRQFVWINHGCPINALYGDDGEMSCGSCGMDFKRMDISKYLDTMNEAALNALRREVSREQD